jgi:predicted RND superfamily exporter protein
MKSLTQTTVLWPQIPSEDAFIRNAIQGIIISIAFAFIILLVATRNILQSVISILSVAQVILSVVAIMHWNGMQLGVSESIAIVILIGFSVDYIIHLSADYMHSKYASRNEKMQQAYREMGISIFSGCITTFGCGACLFGGNFVFFQKFALIICMTVLIAFLTAVFTFGATCHIMGPQNGFGDLPCFKAKPMMNQNESQPNGGENTANALE